MNPGATSLGVLLKGQRASAHGRPAAAAPPSGPAGAPRRRAGGVFYFPVCRGFGVGDPPRQTRPQRRAPARHRHCQGTAGPPPPPARRLGTARPPPALVRPGRRRELQPRPVRGACAPLNFRRRQRQRQHGGECGAVAGPRCGAPRGVRPGLPKRGRPAPGAAARVPRAPLGAAWRRRSPGRSPRVPRPRAGCGQPLSGWCRRG